MVCVILALLGDCATLIYLAQCFVCTLVPCVNTWHVVGLYSGPENATGITSLYMVFSCVFNLPGCLAWPSVRQLRCSLEASESSLRRVVSVHTTRNFSLSKCLVELR